MAASGVSPGAPPGDGPRARPRRGRAGALLVRLARRPARLALTGIPSSAAVLVVLGWSVGAVLLVLAVLPGALESFFVWTLDPTSPRWFRVLLLVACGVVAAGALTTTLLRDLRHPPGRVRVLARDVMTGAVGAAAGGLLLASDAVVPGIGALAGTVAAIVLLHVRLAEGIRLALLAVAAAAPWLAGAVAQFASPDPGLLGWLWIVLLPLAGGFAAFGALYGVARGAESRVGGIRPLLRDDLPVPALALVVAAALAIVVARYSVLRGLFGGLDAELWRLAPSLSWIHAGLVAGAIVLVVVRSARRPLTRVGRRVATAVFGTAAALELAFLGPLILTLAVTAIVLGSGVDISDLVLTATPWLSVGLVAALALVVAHPVFARSPGRWMTWLGAFYVIPGGVASAAGPAFDAVPSFWAKPPQVVAFLVLGAGALVLAGALRPAAAVPGRVVLRLALVPLVAVHATALLPAPWESVLGRAVLVAGILVSVVFLAPRRTADPVHRGRRLLARTTAQLAALVVFVLALPSVLSGETFGILGTLWLAVPVAVGLCLVLVPRTTPAPDGTPPVLVDVEPPDESRGD